MKILFLSDNYSFGGLETHIATYFKYLKMKGHSIVYATSLQKNRPYFKGIDLYVDKFYEIDFPNYNSQSVLDITDKLNQIIKIENIDLIHIHPFLGIYAGILAAVENNLPAALTVHGKISFFSYNDPSSYFLNHVVLPTFLIFTVNKNIYRTHQGKFNIHYLPNPIDEELWSKDKLVEDENYLLLVSRLSPDKIHSVETAIQKIQAVIERQNLDTVIKVVGSGSEEDEKDLVKRYNKVEFLGYKNSTDLKHLMEKAAANLGMGRVVLESLFLRKDTFLVNYDGDVVHLDGNNIEEAEEFNFNGTTLKENYTSKLFRTLLDNKGCGITRDYLKKFSAKNVITRYIQLISEITKDFAGYSKDIKSTAQLFRYFLEADSEKGSLRSEVQEKVQELSTMTMEKDSLRGQLSQAGSERESLRHELQEKRQQIASLIAEKDDLGSRLSRVASERDGLEREVQKKREQISSLTVEKDALGTRLNRLGSERDGFEREVQEKGQQISRLTAEKDALWHQLNEIVSGDIWRLARVYYRVRDNNIILRSIYRVAKRLKASLKESKAFHNLSKFRHYSARYGLNEALIKACYTITKRPRIPMSNGQSAESKRREIQAPVHSPSEVYTGGVKGRVSVVLPVYNQADFLKEAIDAVLNQTYNDIELIIVNDGSTDGVEGVLDFYLDHPKVKILTQENQKLPRAINNGFTYATGEFFTWTSADNVMLPNQIEELVRFLMESPEAAMVYSDYLAIDDRGGALNSVDFRPHNQDGTDPSIIRLPEVVTYGNFHESGDNFIGASFLYRRHVARIIGDYAHDTFGGEDYDYWLRLNCLFKIRHLDKILYKYRVHDNTLNAKARELNLFENIKKVLERDKKRRDFYKKDVNVVRLGFEHSDTQSNRPGGSLLLFKYSRRKSPEVTQYVGRPDVVLVCFIDESLDEYSLESETLARSDLIMTTRIEDFDACRTLYGEKTFCSTNIENDAEFLEKVAKSKLFEKVEGLSYQKIPAIPYTGQKRLNIAFQVENFDIGGLERVVYDLSTNIDKNKFDPQVIVVNRNGMMGRKVRSKGIGVMEVNGDIDSYVEALKTRRIDIINSQYSYFGLEKAKELGIRVIETVQNNYTWLDAQRAKEISRANKIIGKHIAVSRQVKNYHRRRFGIPFSKIDVIPNGFNPEGLQGPAEARITREHLGFEQGDFILLNVASFNGLKSHHLMVSAMSEIKDAHRDIKLIFVGNPMDKVLYDQIKRRIRDEGLEKSMRILEFMERPALKDLYAMADCFVMPSIHEGWSIAIMEAMYFGLTLILTDIGSARDVIVENDLGIIIENAYEDITELSHREIYELSMARRPRNIENLKRAILDIYANHETWRQKARRGTEKVLCEFNVKKMTKKYEEAFLEAYYITNKNGMAWHTPGNRAAGKTIQDTEKDLWGHISESDTVQHSQGSSIPS